MQEVNSILKLKPGEMKRQLKRLKKPLRLVRSTSSQPISGSTRSKLTDITNWKRKWKEQPLSENLRRKLRSRGRARVNNLKFRKLLRAHYPQKQTKKRTLNKSKCLLTLTYKFKRSQLTRNRPWKCPNNSQWSSVATKLPLTFKSMLL